VPCHPAAFQGGLGKSEGLSAGLGPWATLCVSMNSPLPSDYGSLLEDLKGRIRTAQVRAALAVNRDLIFLYWSIGRRILDAQKAEGWGTKVMDRLADDLRSAFPGMKGLSRSNLKFMRAFAEAWVDEPIGQQPVGQIP
jgi:predicted nuclease of restriction endonuclease-like (RecB) superfamily